MIGFLLSMILYNIVIMVIELINNARIMYKRISKERKMKKNQDMINFAEIKNMTTVTFDTSPGYSSSNSPISDNMSPQSMMQKSINDASSFDRTDFSLNHTSSPKRLLDPKKKKRDQGLQLKI